MQHDHVLKKLNFYLWPHPQSQGWGGGLRAKYLPPCCCIVDSLKFDKQHDHVLKKLNFDLLTQPQGQGGLLREGGSSGKIFATILLQS